jgi:hypothetical protein
VKERNPTISKDCLLGFSELVLSGVEGFNPTYILHYPCFFIIAALGHTLAQAPHSTQVPEIL